MNLSKNDVQNILKFTKKYNENEIKNFLEYPESSEFKVVLKKLNLYNDPFRILKNIVNKYNLLKSITPPNIQNLQDRYNINTDNLPPFCSIKNEEYKKEFILNFINFLESQKGKLLTDFLININSNKYLIKKLRYIIAFNIGIIEAEIGLYDDTFLNLFVKLLDDFSRGSEDRINKNIFIMFYFCYKFLTFKYEYSMQPIVSKLKAMFFNYLSNFKVDIFKKIDELSLYKTNKEVITDTMLSRNNIIDEYFLDNLMNLIFNELPKEYIISLINFLEDYEFVNGMNAKADINLLNNLI
tara:strand:+ start:1470 stop:2360 length:891 start_codon:yes stop_codon:yes gene_type:complete